MDKLNSDEKISILMKLSTKEIIYVCQVNKNLSNICKNNRYDSLWIKKIKEDFNTEYKGINAYEEYKRLFLLYNTKYYLLKMKIVGDIEEYDMLYLEKNEVINFIVREIQLSDSEIVTYEFVEEELNDRNTFEWDLFTFTVSEIYITKPY